nr:MAG TPA: hypothetical protein [Caudoviricetes sp.]
MLWRPTQKRNPVAFRRHSSGNRGDGFERV